MVKWLEPITKLEECGSFVISSLTGEIVAEHSRFRKGCVVMDSCAQVNYGDGALRAALRKAGYKRIVSN